MRTSTERVRAAYAAIRGAGCDEIWINLAAEAGALAEAADVDRRVAAGVDLPLAGYVGAVKDNIDLVGLPTTAGCPAFAYDPKASATCVERLVEAGVVFIGKTNLDQFATGLVGTRSPFGGLPSARDSRRISGGSSSGSAVAVALGIVDFALGTDTAGSGRVPAAFNGIVGMKPTRGLVPTTGVIPACASFDCVSIFATTVALATEALAVIIGPDGIDPGARPFPPDAPLGRGPTCTVAIPDADLLATLDDATRAGFAAAVARLEAIGAATRAVDVTPLLEAGTLLYDGAFVAERYAAVGTFIDAHPDEVDPVVGAIISAGRTVTAAQYTNDVATLAAARLAAHSALAEVDALMLPTVAEHPTFEEVAADPRGVNGRLGRFTTFCNLVDLSAIAVPVSSTFGVTFFAAAFGDQAIADLGAAFLGEALPPALTDGAPLVVVGAHLVGQPLNHELTTRGGRRVAATTTSPNYRLYALATNPPKPGLVRTGEAGGVAIEVEVWALPPARFADFVATIPPPLAIGEIELVTGERLPGFVVGATTPPDAVEEITAFGGWRAYVASRQA
jgi:allophanate hydrolase